MISTLYNTLVNVSTSFRITNTAVWETKLVSSRSSSKSGDDGFNPQNPECNLALFIYRTLLSHSEAQKWSLMEIFRRWREEKPDRWVMYPCTASSTFPQTETCSILLANRFLRIFARSFKSHKKGDSSTKPSWSAQHQHTLRPGLFLKRYSFARWNKVTLSMTLGCDNWRQVPLFSSAPLYSFKEKKLTQHRPQQDKHMVAQQRASRGQ